MAATPMANEAVGAILRQVRRIEIVANRAVNDLFAGSYHSVFRGRGMEFDEVREYQPGDEIRTIDWNVTARAGVPFIKRFREERELTVLFAVDLSRSTAFGSLEPRRLALAKCAAMAMFTALKNHDKVGLLTFAGEPLDYFPPRKGKGAVLRLVRELLAGAPPAGRTSIAAALDYVNRVQKRRCVLFLLSDWLDPALATPEFRRTLSVTARRHDLIGVVLRDPRELALRDHGIVRFEDLETGETAEIDTGSARVRAWLATRLRERADLVGALLKRSGIDAFEVVLPDPAEAAADPKRDAVLASFGRKLLELFARRERRR